MNNIFSAAELASMGLPMLPKSRQAIDYRAKSENWLVQYEQGTNRGRGGKIKVYALTSLPLDVQDAIKQKQLEEMLTASQPAPLPSVVK